MSQRYLGGVITANPTTPTLTTESGVWTLEQQFQYSSVWSPKIIGNSVRLRSSASAYLNRTPASASNRKTWTWSAWIKRGTLGTAAQWLFTSDAGGTDQNEFNLAFTSSDQLSVSGALTTWRISTPVYRDPSAWYHIVLAVDTTQSTANNRIRIYVNGVEVTAFGTLSNPTLNDDLAINQASQHNIGIRVGNTSPFDGYIAEVNFIDGRALTPSSFGAFDTNGVWQPLLYTGTYGTNGFYLTFADNSAATATTLGKDYSGNGNNWTPNNISVTAGTTYDSMLDVPTMYADGGNGRGNYAVLNPLTKNTASTVSDGNLAWNCSPGSSGIRSSMALPSSGLIYLEATAGTSSSSGLGMAFGLFTQSVAVGSSYITGVANSWGIYSDASGVIGRNGTNTTGITIITANETYQLAVDLANSRAWLGRNNSWYDSGSGTTGNPSTGANPTFTSLPTDLLVGLWGDNTKTWVVNFGQRPFTYTPPTGFKALNTQNLPAVNITNGAQYFAATLYTGNGSTQSITNTVNGTSFQPDFVWAKRRNAAGSDHYLADAVRGAGKQLISNSTAAESTNNGITSFDSGGFSVGAVGDTNANTGTFIGWQWRAGVSAVTNTAGTITSTVDAGTTQGFSIVTYTGNGTGGATVGHGLGVAPSMIIVKSRANATGWVVGHAFLNGGTNPWQYYISLESTGAQGTTSLTWNNTAPTSSVFSLGSGSGTNPSATMVAYCFAAVAGYSSFGSYTGNGSTDGVFVYLGFRPRYIFVKRTDTTQNWFEFDTSRDPYNVGGNYLLLNASDAEGGAGTIIDILSNGFKWRALSAGVNASGGTYIYACFAENPFNIARAR